MFLMETLQRLCWAFCKAGSWDAGDRGQVCTVQHPGSRARHSREGKGSGADGIILPRSLHVLQELEASLVEQG